MSDSRFYVQCISGNHIMEAVPGSELEARCIKRVQAGYIDALCLNYNECPSCVEDARERARADADYISMSDCPMTDLDGACKDDCSCKNRKEVADSPYADQVQHITATA